MRNGFQKILDILKQGKRNNESWVKKKMRRIT